MYVICELAKYLPKSNCFFFVCHASALWHAHADCECLIMSNNSFGCTLQIAVIQSEAHDSPTSPFSLSPLALWQPSASRRHKSASQISHVKSQRSPCAASLVLRLSRLVCASFNTHSINVRSLCSDFLRISIAAFHFILCFLT